MNDKLWYYTMCNRILNVYFFCSAKGLQWGKVSPATFLCLFVQLVSITVLDYCFPSAPFFIYLQMNLEISLSQTNKPTVVLSGSHRRPACPQRLPSGHLSARQYLSIESVLRKDL